MSTGMQYVLPPGVYPRFRYYRDNLVKLVPRFQRTIEAAKLCWCVSQGLVKFKEILTASDEFNQTKLSVTVFADDLSLITSLEPKLVEMKDADSQQRQVPITWPIYVKEAGKVAHVVVYVIKSHDAETLRTVESRFFSLSESKLRNIIIYNAKVGTSFLFTDLEEANFKVDWETITEQNQSISKQIEHLLEDTVVEILERIVSYITEFVPGDGAEQKQSLLDDVNLQVTKCLQDEHVMDDLSPERQAKLTGPLRETDSKMKPASMPLSDSEKNAKLLTNLVNYLGNKTKCIVCDHLAKKYGIQPSLVNELLNKDFYDYENKFEKVMRGVTSPHWSEVQQDEKSKFKYFRLRFVTNTSDIIHSTEGYIKQILVILDVLGKMKFEIFGLLQQTKVKTYVKVQKTPELLLDLQMELLDIPEVNGCGTIFGKLVLHVTKALTPSTQEDITNLLQQHRYNYGYSTEIISERKELAGGFHHAFEHGSQIRAKVSETGCTEMKKEYPDKKITEGDYLYGSLGCFVHVKQKNKGAEAAGAGNTSQNSNLYGITCAHCVKYCEGIVELKDNNEKFLELGHYDGLNKYQRDLFDIAGIKISQEKHKSCDLTLKDPHGVKCVNNWTFLTGHAKDGMKVYKRGSATKLTEGIIASSNYRTKIMKELQDSYREKNISFNMDEYYNILIQSEPDVPDGTTLFNLPRQGSVCKAFSEEGDSGSVICFESFEPFGSSAISVTAVAILLGAITKEETFLFSIACHLRRSLDKLEEDYNLTIEPACMMVEDGAQPMQIG